MDIIQEMSYHFRKENIMETKYTFRIKKKKFILTKWQMARVFNIQQAFVLVEKHILEMK
jgi:hypothetical protein